MQIGVEAMAAWVYDVVNSRTHRNSYKRHSEYHNRPY